MRESIGSVALYNIIITFILVTFAVLSGTMSYSKAFKVNNRILDAIEKYEGYPNDGAIDEINTQLTSMGYQKRGAISCPERKGFEKVENLNTSYEICIYKQTVDTREYSGRYTRYGAISYIYLDFFGLTDLIRVPVFGVTRDIFTFQTSAKKNN